MGPLIFSMALPAMISMIINALYNIVDSIFVAKYSQDALAAVSLVYPLQMLVVAIGVGTGVGVNSLIARRLGEKRQKHADSAAEHGVAPVSYTHLAAAAVRLVVPRAAQYQHFCEMVPVCGNHRRGRRRGRRGV